MFSFKMSLDKLRNSLVSEKEQLKWFTRGKSPVYCLRLSFSAYRQVAHLVGIPEFSWLDKYKQQLNTTADMTGTDHCSS